MKTEKHHKDLLAFSQDINRALYFSMNLNTTIEFYDNPFKGEWIYYDKLAILIPRQPNYDVKRFILQRRDFRDKKSQKILQRIFEIAALNSFGSLGAGSLDINGFGKQDRNKFFSWSQRSLKLFDFQTGQLTYTIKTGMRNDLAHNAINFRSKYQYDFIPNFISSGDQWYKEIIIPGQVLGSIKNQQVYERSIKIALSHINKLATDTIHRVNHNEYLEKLRSEIIVALKNYQSYYPDTNYNRFVAVIDKLCNTAATINTKIPLVLSHGDFHPANILIDEKQNIYIVDWETIAERSIWYDPATILCKFRQIEGRRKMILNANNPDIKNSILFNDEMKHYKMEAVTAILILENINAILAFVNLPIQPKQYLMDYLIAKFEEIT